MSFEDFVTHISEHNSPYSRGTIHGVLMDTLDCLKHLILDGKSVRFSDLGLFSTGNNLNPRAWALDLENGLLVHDQHHHLREQFSAERENILAHTRRISHFDQIEQIKDYPDQVRKLLARIHRVKAHLLLKRII
jgi:phosphatidylserine/phosphatidylglycerophosphate/cardiolipin synthase-like enzyme